MIAIKTTILKADKTLKSGHILAAGAEIISHAFLNQSSKEEIETLTKRLDEAEFSLFKARGRKLKGDSLKVYSDAVKQAKSTLEGVRLPVAEIALILQGVHPVKLSPAEFGVLKASLKGLSIEDIA